MKLYDLTQELFSAKVYPGDPVPEQEKVLDINKGDVCNLTALKIGSHVGTHLDAPPSACARRSPRCPACASW